MLLVTKTGSPLREVGLSPGTFVGSKTGSFSQELRPSPDVSLATQNQLFFKWDVLQAFFWQTCQNMYFKLNRDLF